MSARHQRTTLDRTLQAGRVLGSGTHSTYRAVRLAPGERHVRRDDLMGDGAGPDHSTTGEARPLVCLAHVTDLQIADVQSPARFEFFNELDSMTRFASLIPAQRPQEALTIHAVDAMIRSLNDLTGGPVTSAPIDAVVTTGDAIDNAQWNETQMFLSLLDGGRVRPNSGGLAYEGVQGPAWPGTAFWRPDGGPDLWRERFGFPTHPGLLDRALAEFDASGLRYPWLACYGNHEALTQGVGPMTEAVRGLLGGDRKPMSLPDRLATADARELAELSMSSPEQFATGPYQVVTPDPGRRAISRHEFVEAHFRDGGTPFGHGFSQANRRDGTAFYSYDLPTTRLIALDTNYVIGGADGSINGDQLRWLEEHLIEVHSSYRTADGELIHTGNEDRLVVVFSHHGSDTLASDRAVDPADGHGTAALVGILHRFENVVLWLNGHTHTNAIRPRPNPARPGAGFWEVTTCAIVDWPCQARIVELVDNGDETLSVVCTMVDHDSPLDLDEARGVDLATLHRELAANIPWTGFESGTSGAIGDRNVELRIRAPFALERLKAGQGRGW